jgi:hypothetical protein
MVGPAPPILFLNIALLPLLLLKIMSVRVLDTIVCSGPLVWLFFPAWGAVYLTIGPTD